MKKCPKCGIESNNFAKSSRNKDGLQNRCKSCVAVNDKLRWQDEAYKEAVTVRRNKFRSANVKRMLDLKKTLACTDCGLIDHRCMQFDHISDDKEFNVSEMVNRASWGKILKEIDKCEPVCSNCHDIRTYERRING